MIRQDTNVEICRPRGLTTKRKKYAENIQRFAYIRRTGELARRLLDMGA